MLEHHAYLFEGSQADFDSIKESVQPFVATWYERFGIDDARALVGQASLKREGDSTCLIGAATIATEAQQALLKLFEEPREGLQFILIAPHGTLLPTLRSRMQMWEETRQHPGPRSSDPLYGGAPRQLVRNVAAFLKASSKERSDIITAMLKDDEGTKERVRELLDGLEQELVKKMSDPAARTALTEIAMVRDYVRDRSPSLKMLLEHLALSVPIF